MEIASDDDSWVTTISTKPERLQVKILRKEKLWFQKKFKEAACIKQQSAFNH